VTVAPDTLLRGAILSVVLTTASTASADAPALREKAQAAWARGDVDAALKLLDEAVAAEPDHLDTRMNLGIVAAQAQRYPMAIAAFRAIIRRDKRHYDAHFNLGKVLVAAGKHAAGITMLTQAARLAPAGDVSATIEIAATHLGLGREKKARKLLGSLKPIPVRARLLLVFMDFRAERCGPALEHAVAAASQDPSHPVLLTRALARLHAGQPDRAMGELQDLVRTAPATQANIPYALGLAAFSTGDLDGAYNWFLEARGRAPEAFSGAIDPMAFPTRADRAYLGWVRSVTAPPAWRFTKVTVTGPPACQPAVVVAAMAPSAAALSRCAALSGTLTSGGFEASPACAAASAIRSPLLEKARCTVSLSVQSY